MGTIVLQLDCSASNTLKCLFSNLPGHNFHIFHIFFIPFTFICISFAVDLLYFPFVMIWEEGFVFSQCSLTLIVNLNSILSLAYLKCFQIIPLYHSHLYICISGARRSLMCLSIWTILCFSSSSLLLYSVMVKVFLLFSTLNTLSCFSSF